MGEPVSAAEDSVGRVARPVPGGVGPSRLGGLHVEFQHRPDAATVPAVAARSRAELVTREEQGKAHLRDLDTAELDPAGRLAFPGRRPAGEAPPPGRAWNMCQMKGRLVLGSFPWMAIRKRRPQPARTRSGHAGARALITASAISWAQWFV